VCFCHSVPVLFAFVALVLVSLVQTQEIGWEERLQSDLFCVDGDVKAELSGSAQVQRDTGGIRRHNGGTR